MSKKRITNPVAKFAGEFNKAVTHRDRKNDYKRSTKHKGKFPIGLFGHKRNHKGYK